MTDLVSRAGVARASFHRNFGSIDDVIASIADEMSDEQVEDLSPILTHRDELRWREFLFSHYYRLADDEAQT